jgi:hypothetical protein
VQGGDHGANNMVDLMDEREEEVQESMVLNLSDNSNSSVNMMEAGFNGVPLHHQQGQGQFDVIQIGQVRTIYGPELPPDMIWFNVLESLLPDLYSASVPLSLRVSPFSLLKRTWSIAFQSATEFRAPLLTVGETPRQMQVLRRKVARALTFQSDDMEEPISLNHSQCLPIFTGTPDSAAVKKRGRKARTLVLQPTVRRFTRSCLNKEGYRPKALEIQQVQPKKKPRAKLWLVEEDFGKMTEEIKDQNNNAERKEMPTAAGNEEEDGVSIPITPILVMQRVGVELGIDPAKLTKEQLTAEPRVSSTSSSDDDK